AEAASARVMLIGDIDRGGVFAWLKGTYDLIQGHHRPLLKGMLINKFRGDVSLLHPGISMFEEHVPVPVLGVIPWREIELEDEDSQNLESRLVPDPKIRVVVVRLPYLSNFTDFDPLRQIEGLSLRFSRRISDLEDADLIILPGSKNTLNDLNFLKRSGFAEELQRLSGKTWIMGICGGYQMLGDRVEDPQGMEYGGSETGLGLLPMQTTLGGDKQLVRHEYQGKNWFEGIRCSAYEIHLGRSFFTAQPPIPLMQGQKNLAVVDPENRILGTYLHGLLESSGVLKKLFQKVSGTAIEVPESFEEA
ncbi:uncharacterized protein METZ01_LOCUS370739, partial [marine metagenome]